MLLCLLLATLQPFAQQPPVTHVITHNRTTIVCDPAKGEKAYPKWGVFPAANFPVRKIMMKLTLGSPDSILTAHWDYLDHITIRRKAGVNGKPLNYELGRMLTPYGSVFGKGWHWQWEVDVTDFAPFLRDSVEIEYTHSGYEAVDVGWALTIDFEILSGPPVVTPLAITQLWNGSYKYGDSTNKIETQLLPVNFESLPNAALSRIRIQHTGHGMDKPKGCSEFCSRWRALKIDSQRVDFRDMWKDCGANPLYPQGGTWIYDRAYWCPGDLQVPDVIDVPVKQGRHTASITMEPYTATENIQAAENIAAYLFQYTAPKNKVDAAVEKILVPTNEQQYFRLNPACFNPQFIIRNLGSKNLRSAILTYGTAGFKLNTYQWKGDLKFNETAVINLPGEILFHAGVNTFTVTLTKPNGVTDSWTGDNELSTAFTAPAVLPTNFIVQLLTNNKPADNEISLTGNHSDTVFRKLRNQLKANTLYRDTISLKEGQYELCLTDSAGDGLEFWAEPQNGDGYLRLLDMKGTLLHAFESDCGNGEKLSFTASPAFVPDTVHAKYAFTVYPRVITEKTEFTLVSNKTSKMTVLITVGGVVWEKHDYAQVRNAAITYSLGYLPRGRIVLEVLMDGVSRFKARLNKR